MKVIVDFCLIPIGTSVSLSPYVAACEKVLTGAGLKTALHANGTNIEGEWDAVFAAIKRCHEAVHAYNADCTKTIGLQVKTLSQRAPVLLGTSIDRFLGDFWIIVNNVKQTPAVFVMKPEEVIQRAHRGEKDGRVSYWLQPRSYEQDEFRENWGRIGSP